jgi:hypothetical protein
LDFFDKKNKNILTFFLKSKISVSALSTPSYKLLVIAMTEICYLCQTPSIYYMGGKITRHTFFRQKRPNFVCCFF